jgi:hypothetical protein
MLRLRLQQFERESAFRSADHGDAAGSNTTSGLSFQDVLLEPLQSAGAPFVRNEARFSGLGTASSKAHLSPYPPFFRKQSQR